MRIRIIKPEFFADEELGEMEPIVRLLYIGLWCLADKYGVLEYRLKRIRAMVLPYDDIALEALQKHFTTLSEAGMIDFWTCEEGRRWVFIRSFTKHQRLTTYESKTESDNPKPPDWLIPPEALQKYFKSGDEARAKRVRSTSERREEKRRKEKRRSSGCADAAAAGEDSEPGLSPEDEKVAAASKEGAVLVERARRFRAVHPQCSGYHTGHFQELVKAWPGADVDEALRAFELHWGGAHSFSPRSPAAVFVNYLARSMGNGAKEEEKKSRPKLRDLEDFKPAEVSGGTTKTEPTKGDAG